MTEFTIAVFEGDGIGPEIMAPTLRLLDRLAAQSASWSLRYDILPAGAQHYADTGEALPEASVAGARAADAILLSAMGLPRIRYPDGTEIAPQVELRKILHLYAGVRPVRIAPGIPTPLAGVETLDFVLIRESTEGLFHSKGHVTDDLAEETLRITRATSEKLFRFAFDLAAQRKAAGLGPGRVTCVDKANIFKAFAYFRGLFDAEAAQHPDLQADYAYVDAAALWMVTQPQRFDVMVTENMFGDILSDLGAGLMGGLGFAPSADIGDDHAVFQPCHGTAPDIAGQGKANPVAMVLSAAMMLDWLGHRHENAALRADGARLRAAVETVLQQATVRTPDMGGQASTDQMCAAIEQALG